MDKRTKDITGQRFGKLVAKSATKKRQNNNVIWECLCDCGNLTYKRQGSLHSGNVKSCGCARKFPVGESSFNYLFDKYKRGASARQYPFELTKEQFKSLTTMNCFYCGDAPNQTITTKNYHGSYIYNGIDRINNTEGYTTENTVPCCGICNQLKGSLQYDIFIKQIYKIANKYE